MWIILGGVAQGNTFATRHFIDVFRWITTKSVQRVNMLSEEREEDIWCVINVVRRKVSLADKDYSYMQIQDQYSSVKVCALEELYVIVHTYYQKKSSYLMWNYIIS
jgi:hypothetical protein